jgi:hypothetical protein
MDTQVASLSRKDLLKALLIDMAALAFILFTPSLAHFFSFPVYMLEPMRLMMILSIAHSSKKNSYLLALSLPLFSFLVSGHPEPVKMMIITAELTLNVFLFYFLAARIRNSFASAFLSILASKAFCYLAYLVIFSLAFVREEAGTVFLLVQALTTLIFSSYLFLALKNKGR